METYCARSIKAPNPRPYPNDAHFDIPPLTPQQCLQKGLPSSLWPDLTLTSLTTEPNQSRVVATSKGLCLSKKCGCAVWWCIRRYEAESGCELWSHQSQLCLYFVSRRVSSPGRPHPLAYYRRHILQDSVHLAWRLAPSLSSLHRDCHTPSSPSTQNYKPSTPVQLTM